MRIFGELADRNAQAENEKGSGHARSLSLERCDQRRLADRRAELRRNGGEGRPSACVPRPLHDGDDGDRNARGDQAVFDRGCARTRREEMS